MSGAMALLEYMAAKKLLQKYGIRSIDSSYVKSADAAVAFADGDPIVMKVLSDKALHKSKAGLVRLNLGEEKDIRKAFADLSNRAKRLRPYKIIAQRMAAPGIEMIIGGRTDQQFGQIVLIGLGGIYVEVFRDFALRICPITRYDAGDMLDQLRSKNVVTYNGKATKTLEDLLLKTSKLLAENNGIKELDLNPVIMRANGYDVVDIRILK